MMMGQGGGGGGYGMQGNYGMNPAEVSRDYVCTFGPTLNSFPFYYFTIILSVLLLQNQVVCFTMSF